MWYMLPAIIFGIVLIQPSQVLATVDACDGSVSPSSLAGGTSGAFSFVIHNDSGQQVEWIRLTTPSANYAITGYSVNGWTVATTDTTATLIGSALGAGDQMSVGIIVAANSSGESTASWTLQMSDVADGSDPTNCTGVLETSITAAPTGTPSNTPTSTPTGNPTATPSRTPTSTVAPTSVPDIKAPIVTLTDVSFIKPIKEVPTLTGQAVDNREVIALAYTLTEGKIWVAIRSTEHLNTESSSFSLKPSVDISGTYTLQIRAQDSSGNYGYSKKYGFTIDRVGPVIKLHTDITKPFTNSPEITGIAVDTADIQSISYAVGVNGIFQNVHKASKLSDTQTQFVFLPEVIDEGNHLLRVKAEDLLGNVSQETHIMLLIDRLPPKVANAFFLVGPQPVIPKPDGEIYLPEKISSTLYISSIGGATAIVASFTHKETNKQYEFIFSPKTGTNLWSTEVQLTAPGSYSVTTRSIDGVGKKQEKLLGNVSLVSLPQVSHKNYPIAGATVTLYVADEETGSYRRWEAESYGQVNPQITDSTGVYSFYVPKGTYYVSVTAKQMLETQTTSFDQLETGLITASLPLVRVKTWWFFPFAFWKTPTVVSYNPSFVQTEFQTTTELFSLPSILSDGSIVTNPVEKPVQSFLVTSNYHPLTPLLLRKDIENQSVVIAHERIVSLDWWKKKGTYDISVYADPDGNFIDTLNPAWVPVTYTVSDDRHIIKQTWNN